MDEQNISNTVINKPENNSQKQIAGAIIIAGVLIAGAVLLKGSTPPSVVNKGDTFVPTDVKLRPVTKDEHILGNVNAEVVVVEYSDTECPFCKMFHETMHKVIKEKGDKVAWVYRHYPIPQLHQRASKEAEATECAWEQGGNDTFWKYTDEIYTRTKSNDSLDPKELPAIAKTLGLNLTSFETCFSSGKYQAKVENDVKGGEEAGVNSTPSSFILKKGKLVDTIRGAQPFSTVITQIEKALK
ncbi:DsbA family protein [Candidatus Nomurabacteria bacterium]|nr:DsbA family protein [Candidatus Nomurabacteria bacterium]